VQLQRGADQAPASQAEAKRYKVFLQLLDQRNQVIAQRDAEPAGESRPTTSWKPGEVVFDNHGLLIPPGTPPGSYRRIVGMYDAETGQRAKLADGASGGEGDYISLSPVNVQRAKVPPPLEALPMLNRQSFDFGAITLLGHDRYKRGFGHAPETPVKPGDLLHLTFYWRANAEPRADWWFDLALTDSNGTPVANLSAPLVSDTYSTTMWQKDEIVRGEHDLQVPADLAPGTYRLSLTMLPDQDTEAGSAYLGTVRVTKGE
jgi:mannosyltransferase